jgi:hypothetical protein
VSDERDEGSEVDADGCGIIVGLVIASFAIGYIWTAPYGWLAFGIGLIALYYLGKLSRHFLGGPRQ